MHWKGYTISAWFTYSYLLSVTKGGGKGEYCFQAKMQMWCVRILTFMHMPGGKQRGRA